ncbi:hypothetical protein [Prauserella muralis]|uniref:hypothetical protein n=1 Tax=Prauserella muralis TaxID=588067 RepID=UPI0011ADA343|nr:hypothetical protein [Prauserella muralis]TWE13830.1 hypothetical protein FHX69_5959 [Prauserella muralis]
MRNARLVAGYAAVLGTLPYLSLKISWLTGGSLGLADPGLVDSPVMVAANAFTAGMEFVAIAVALAFTHRWGERLPGWLVLFPMWVGTGFLAPIALASPAIGVDFLTTAHDGGGLEPWVRPLVYGGFAWQGITLLTVFVLYARARWERQFTGHVTAAGRAGVLAGTGAALALFAAAVHGLWVFAPVRDDATLAVRFIDGVYGVLGLAAVAGAVLLTRPGTRFRTPLVLAWAGSGALFSWGFWGAASALATGEGGTAELLLNYAQVVAGVLLAVALAGTARGVTRERAFQPTRRVTVPE